MKLGEMLIRDGRINDAQLHEALEVQGREGGRLGTVLVEQNLIDLDALTVYLGLELGIPIATGAMLERAKRAAVRLLSPEQAYRYKCVPLVVQDRQLIAAVEDPHDFETLDALSRLTGYRVIPRVAPEIRVYYYVERYFGIPRPARFLVFGDAPRGQVTPLDDSLPAPPLPGLPPVNQAPVTAPSPPPFLRRRRGAHVPVDAFADVESRPDFPAMRPGEPAADLASQEALELEAEDLLIELEGDADEAAEAAPTAAVAPALPSPSERMAAIEYVPITVTEALARMTGASERGDVAEAVMSFAAGIFDVSALMIVRDNLALGWRSTGAPGSDRIDCTLIPLDAPSMFQAAVKSDALLFHDAPAPSTVHGYFFKVLRVPHPARATVTVVSIGRRVVNLLYGHRSSRPELTDGELTDVRDVIRAAADAYVRLIAIQKGK
jgi:hypothetical protein